MKLPRARMTIICLGLLLLTATWIGAQAQQSQAENQLEPATEGHRGLRDNVPPGFPAPTEPAEVEDYLEAGTVISREDQLMFYPCEMCHASLPLNPEPRKLVAAPHPAALNHGSGQFWCLDCHNADDRNQLNTLAGTKVGFNESYQVCRQCHYQPHKDWSFGAHGKRAENWQGDRQIYSCTHCHDPHDPSIKPRQPEPPPPVRKGLTPIPEAAHEPETQND